MPRFPQGTFLTLPDAPLFSCAIRVNDTTTPLYAVDLRDPKRTVCYIEMRDRATFSVELADARPHRQNGFQATVLVNGEWKRGKNILVEAPPGEWSMSSTRGTDNVEMPFLFGESSTTDDPDSASFGSIELRYRRIKKAKPRARRREVKAERDESCEVVDSNDAPNATGPTSNEPPRRPQKPERQYKCKFLEPKDSPYHTFEFRYRSRAYLEREGLLRESPPEHELHDPVRRDQGDSRGSSMRPGLSRRSPSSESQELAKLRLLEAELAELHRAFALLEERKRSSSTFDDREGEGEMDVDRRIGKENRLASRAEHDKDGTGTGGGGTRKRRQSGE
ncbi:hypothetical protein JCM10212_003145 [Sporobolomyces blumeae]